MIGGIIDWLTAATSWQGDDGILARLGEHLLYTLVVVLLAALVAIPVGLWVGHTGRGRWLVSLANAARAVPTLGLLFALVLWLGPQLSGELYFTAPSIIVLVLLAIPPILSGTYAGVEAVDQAARDAARGIGMSPGQVLRQVELPCALPLLLSGLRASILQVVATATIAAYVGLGGLGRFIIDGLAVQDYAQTAGGAVLVAVLAVLLDAIAALVQRAVVSPGLTTDPSRPARRGSAPSRLRPSPTSTATAGENS